MLFSTVGQGALFIWMMAAGVAIGAWYAVVTLLRRFIQAGGILTFLCDLIFGAGSAIILLCFMVLGNYGQPRLYLVLAVILGLFLFFFALAAPMNRLLKLLEAFVRKIMSRLAKNRLINVIFR